MAALPETDAVLTGALQLPVAERASVAERVLASIDGIETEVGNPVDPESMAELAAECQRRLER